MTVKIKKGRLGIFLYCPLCLMGFVVKKVALNSAKRTAEEDFIISVPDKETIKKIIKALRTAKKFHGKLELISVKAEDGTTVKIKL